MANGNNFRFKGAVGALFLWSSGVVQHGGVVLGPHLRAPTPSMTASRTARGNGDLLRVAHECSAVGAACLLTRRDYLDVGGMDEIRLAASLMMPITA